MIYWSKVCIFLPILPTRVLFEALAGGFPRTWRTAAGIKKLDFLSYVTLKTALLSVLSQQQCVTDGWTDRWMDKHMRRS